MKLRFRDLNPQVTEAVVTAFAGIPAIDVKCADVFDGAPADAIVSPANSHGWMDRGIDAVYRYRFGPQIERELQDLIARLPTKLLAVGEAMIVWTGYREIPLMIAAPTMMVPSNVAHTENAYLAFRAVLRAVRHSNLQVVICPGLATLTGRMVPQESARQMRRAWDEQMGLVPAESHQ
ncbi:Appr-1-p processing protein [Paraburkholderia sp. Tr-20389]|uniref:macro domain-containing protein n=1 Tax=Paraburkholderia sp. Tr-20389 TaxID=2703903 RepID=UPI00197EC8EB|nr:macro domain-containing protein [Paraburkholderia sp. Tr-20389]MBN3756082.1 Appr-1-p processing protein [Paraburkholderia sp. Tr-20389]